MCGGRDILMAQIGLWNIMAAPLYPKIKSLVLFGSSPLPLSDVNLRGQILDFSRIFSAAVVV